MSFSSSEDAVLDLRLIQRSRVLHFDNDKQCDGEWCLLKHTEGNWKMVAGLKSMKFVLKMAKRTDEELWREHLTLGIVCRAIGSGELRSE